MNITEKDAQELYDAKEKANKLYAVYSKAYDESKAALDAWESAKLDALKLELYQKAKRQVMRDLLKVAGNIADKEGK